jgi:MOSC domain-containing protein YiiM
MTGKVVAVNVSERKGTRKNNIGKVKVLKNFGLEGDAHAGNWHRQVSLLAQESIDKMRSLGLVLFPGDFAENITTSGIDLLALDVGTKIKIGNVVLEITQKGKECHLGCEIRKLVGDCIMPKEGVFAKVVEGGEIQVGDQIEVQEK